MHLPWEWKQQNFLVPYFSNTYNSCERRGEEEGVGGLVKEEEKKKGLVMTGDKQMKTGNKK